MRARTPWILLALLGLACGGADNGTTPVPPPPPVIPPPPPPPPPSTVPVVTATIPASGGTLSVTAVNHPYQGLALTIKPGTFSDAGSWKVGVDSAATLTGLPAGSMVSGPAIVLTTAQTRGNHLISLRIPVTFRAGYATVIVMRDPSRNLSEVPPIVAQDATTLTIAGTHFNASLLQGSGTTAGLQSSAISSAYLHPVQIPNSALENVTASLFSPLDDIWPVADAGSYQFPNGHGAASALLSVLSNFAKLKVGKAFKPVAVPGMYADTAAFAAMLLMAKRFQTVTTVLGPALQELADVLSTLRVSQRDSLTSLNIRAGIAVTKRPQLLVFGTQFNGSLPFDQLQFATVFAGLTGGIRMADPTAPSAPRDLSLGSTGWTTPTFRTASGLPQLVPSTVLSAQLSSMFPLESFADVLAQMGSVIDAAGDSRSALASVLATAAGFSSAFVEFRPTPTAAWGLMGNLTTIRDSLAQFRVRCTSCTAAVPQFTDPTQQPITITDQTTGVVVDQGTATGFRPGGLSLFRSLPPGALKAFGGFGSSLMSIVSGSVERMLTPLTINMRKLAFQLSPDTLQSAPEDTVRYTMRVGPETGDIWAVDWNWGDGTAVERITADSSAKHVYHAAGAFPVIALLRLAKTSTFPPVARSTATVVVFPPVPFWRIDSLGVTGTSSSQTVGNIKSQLLINPGDGFVYAPVPSAQQWATFNVAANGQGGTVTAPVQAGTVFSLANTSYTRGTLGNGTVIGSGVALSDCANRPTSLNATMTGKTLRGTVNIDGMIFHFRAQMVPNANVPSAAPPAPDGLLQSCWH